MVSRLDCVKLLLLSSVISAVLGALPMIAHAAPSLIVVNPSTTYQVIDGFGVSQAGGDPNQVNPPGIDQDSATPLYQYVNRSQVMDLAFSDWNGIGLTILRMKVNANMEPAPGVWNVGGDFDGNYADDDISQPWIMREAAGRGPVKIIASVWSPPGWMKTNGKTQYGGSVIDADGIYQDLAEFVTYFATVWASRNGVDIYAVSPANEPDNVGSPWDTCYWDNWDLDRFFTDYLAPAFADARQTYGITTKLIAPETASWGNVLWWLPQDSLSYDIVAGHLYDTADPSLLYTDKPVWQTEMSGAYDVWSMPGALSWAQLIHKSLTGGGVSAWTWFLLWGGVEGDDDNARLIAEAASGAGFVGSPTLYALGNFSKFIRPGFVRVAATSNDSALRVSAYKDLTSGQIVTVVINPTSISKDLAMDIPNVSRVIRYTTDAQRKLERYPRDMRSASPSGAAITANSITTFVSRSPADVLWQKPDSSLQLWLVNGPNVRPIAIAPPPSGTQIHATGDFDNDGQSDILLRASTGPTEIWFQNRGAIAAKLPSGSIGNDWQIQGAGDFDGDGTSDILWRHDPTTSAHDQPVIWFMRGANVRSHVWLSMVPTSDWQVRGIGDFDGDAKSDIVWRNNNTGTVQIWFMNGSAIRSVQNMSSGVGNDWQIASIADFNGDGMSDLFWRSTVDGQPVVWLMSQATATSQVWLAARGLEWQARTGDFNADGKADIFWVKNTGATQVWYMNGTTISALSSLPTVTTGTQLKAAAFFDH